VLPALSVALADTVCVPSPNDHAGPETPAHVSEATPETASLDEHVIETAWSTGYVPAFPE
jgi:hypothetical protein